jgi:hypothetical protein
MLGVWIVLETLSKTYLSEDDASVLVCLRCRFRGFMFDGARFSKV